MTELLIVLSLCAELAAPSPDAEFPDGAAIARAKCLSPVGKELVGDFATTQGIHPPGLYEVDWDNFDGVYVVFWRRAQGRALPRPIDPLGPAKQ